MKGYDHAFLLQAKGDGKKVAAHVWSADEKIAAEGLHHRSGSAILLRQLPRRHTVAGEPNLTPTGKGWLLESEFLPDSPNHPEWPQPDCFLRPGEEYSSLTEYQFIAE
ncbi:aldose 1-epimerase (mutarotase) [Escherichia coli]|uniref:Aldose 1-epimerase (Mutarotase) n=1 Tax=Escherichia coli TaxID=562 RepID=A0A377F885_ECOLX|nr:aldose 1-epimerase (mutarotase) [Escherichia coli]